MPTSSSTVRVPPPLPTNALKRNQMPSNGLRRALTAQSNSRVAVSVGRAIGRRCRFLKADGKFGPTTSCRRTFYLRAKGTTRWTFTKQARLPRGKYKVYVRGIDAAANYERKLRRGNFLRLRVK